MKELTKNIREFITGGNSTFTVLNEKSAVRYTFKVKKSPDDKVFFVSLLNGADNTSNYVYIGVIKDEVFKLTKKSALVSDSTPVRAFKWLWNNLKKDNEFPECFHFYHEGRCAKCGRKLTTPESIERGFGPVCYGI